MDNIPRAYLNIVFFDERFNFVKEGSIAVRVSQTGDGTHTLVLPLNTKAPKNGYAYIYLSNENDDAVYFDNFTVSDTRGRIIEENHYYAFGLKIASISSVKMGDVNEGSLKNNNLYNDKELWDDADLDWYDYGFRNYDPQIGRFPQLDPLTDDYPELTNYQYASNEPIANVDMDGLEKASSIADFAYDYASKSNLVLGNVDKFSAELTKTASHLIPIAIQSIRLASIVVESQINNASLNKNVDAQVSKNVTDYYLAHKNEMSLTDLLTLNALTKNYYKGLNCMAWWAKGDFLKLNRAVINSTLPDALKVQLVELGIQDSQEGWHSILRSGADVGVFISSLGLFPEVGIGPKSPFKSPTQQSIVESKAGLKFTGTTVKRYISSERTINSSDLQRAINSKAYPDPQGSNASAYYIRIIRSGKSYNLKVVYDKETNTLFHFHYSRQAMGPLSKISK